MPTCDSCLTRISGTMPAAELPRTPSRLRQKRRRFSSHGAFVLPAHRFDGASCEEMTVSDLTGLFLGLVPFLTLLLWSEVRDRRRDRADGVRAEIHAATNHVLGGETMLSVQVEAARRWRRGRVHLSVPGGYESLIARVSRTVIERLPNRYELVIHRGSAKA